MKLGTWFSWWRPGSLAERGEAYAARYLRRLGYTIVARRMRSRFGELDLVAVDGRTVVFVEVKTRTSDEKGLPADAVDDEKQRRLTRAALGFLKSHGLLDHSARFDVLAVTWPEEARRPTVTHYQDAFQASGQGQLFS